MKMNFVALAALLTSVVADPKLSYPFNNQLPPVAEWGKPFTYTFSADTFTSTDGSAITYSSSDLPSWLSLNDRTLSGTPAGGSGLETLHFTLQAKDNTGSAQEDCILQMTETPLPTYSESSLTSVLEKSGAVANENSYVLEPNQPFQIEFPSDFFTSDGRSVVGHYAVQSDHSPLPIWLNFDGQNGKFSGTAPSVNSDIAQAQRFQILYIVSTYQGYTTAAATFNMLLGANTLTMNISQDSVNATVGRFFTYGAPMSQVKLNNQPITTANLSAAKASIPGDAQSWLHWDNTNFTLSGSPPKSAAGTTINVGIEIVDKFDDAVSWDVGIAVSNQTSNMVFSTSSLPAANATRGQWFEYDLGDYVLQKDISLSVDVPWLTVHGSNLSINGLVPKDFKTSMVSITASLNNDGSNKAKRADDDGDSLTAHLELYGVGPMASSSSSASSRSASSMSRTTSGSRSHSHTSSISTISATGSSSSGSRTSPATSSATSTSSSTPLAPLSKSAKSNNNAVAIGCGVAIPVAFVIIAAILLFLCCRRRRQRRDAAAAAGGTAGNTSTDYDDDYDEKYGGRGLGPNGGAIDESQISAPRPSSKGLAMAPVFHAESSSDSEYYEDALEYPGELGDEHTVFGTPNKEDKLRNDGDPWDSPQRASTLNFLAMDGSSGSDLRVNAHSANDDDNATLASLNPNYSSDFGPPPHREEDDVVGDIPRESWRHTNTGERRWQDARLSNSSLASIVPTEPPTVQLASTEFEPIQPQPSYQPLHSNQHIPRDYSSGVLHRVGSHSSSQYSDSIRNSEAMSQRISGHYRTESSSNSHGSEDFSDSSSGGANFRPYQDENGELQWRQEAVGASNARLNNVGLDRKPSAAKTPRGDQGEFVFV